MKKKSGPLKGKKPDETKPDVDQMKMDYLQPDVTLNDIARKYKLSLNAVYYISKREKWAQDKKEVNETALIEAITEYTKKRKKVLLSDLEAIQGIEDKIFKMLKGKNATQLLADVKISDLIALIKCKYDLIAKFGTNVKMIEANIKEGDNNFNFNFSGNELEMKIVNLMKDMKTNKTVDNRIKALKERK